MARGLSEAPSRVWHRGSDHHDASLALRPGADELQLEVRCPSGSAAAGAGRAGIGSAVSAH